MLRKMLSGAALVAIASGAQAATDYPSGYTKCAKEGETCSFTGTRSVAYGKAGTFVYANLTGPLTCSASRFPAINVGTPRYCSYGAAAPAPSPTPTPTPTPTRRPLRPRRLARPRPSFPSSTERKGRASPSPPERR